MVKRELDGAPFDIVTRVILQSESEWTKFEKVDRAGKGRKHSIIERDMDVGICICGMNRLYVRKIELIARMRFALYRLSDNEWMKRDGVY